MLHFNLSFKSSIGKILLKTLSNPLVKSPASELKNVNSFQERLTLYKKFERIPRNSSPSRHRNRCWMTGRSRGYYKDFGLSRHVLREMAYEGLIPGLTKSSW